jgi:hypothetical protein
MDISALREMLRREFSNSPNRATRAVHYLDQLKTGVDGLAGLGIVVTLHIGNLQDLSPPQIESNPLASLNSAIELMQKASRHANGEYYSERDSDINRHE